MQNLDLKKNVASIGEEIGYDLGKKMVQDFQTANESDVYFYVIGRNIIDEILAQPGCVGMKFFNAYNELGEKTMVYVGLDENGQSILEYTCINNQGILEVKKGIVADRIDRGGPSKPGVAADDWNWQID